MNSDEVSSGGEATAGSHEERNYRSASPGIETLAHSFPREHAAAKP